MNSVISTTRSAIYLAIKHVFPDVPMNAGIFDALHVREPKGTFLFAEYPRPVSGCSAEVSQRIAEAVFAALVEAIPDKLFAASAGTCGNMGIGGYDPEKSQRYVMYYFTGGGYGGSTEIDGLSNGCSITGISKMQPVEVLEQLFPVLFEEFSLAERSGGAGYRRGGYGVQYAIRLRRGQAEHRSSWITAASDLPAHSAAAMRGSTRSRSCAPASHYRPPHLPRIRTSSSTRATSSPCARLVAADMAIPSSASPSLSRATSAADISTRTTPARSTASSSMPT